MTTPGSTLAGRYLLERLLAEGGMGRVWIARHLTLDRLVAVKVMTPEAHSSAILRARFEREAKACAQLRSPHVVQVFDYGVEADEPYLVMELLEGEDLGSLQQEKPVWSLAEVAWLIHQAARGLTEAHEADIVHRDIKLSNLFLARMPGETILKILDFGIARVFEERGPKMTSTDVQLGTPSYMAPEVVLDQPVDHRVDLWGLAVVAFRLLTGRPPFDGESPLEVVQNIADGRRWRAHDVVEGLPPALETFFDRGLATAPADRFQSAAELARALSYLAESYPGAIGRMRGGDEPEVPTVACRLPTAAHAAPPPETEATRIVPTRPDPRPAAAVALEATPSVWLPGSSSAPPPAQGEPPTQRAPRPRRVSAAMIGLALASVVTLGIVAVRSPMTPRPRGGSASSPVDRTSVPHREAVGTASAAGSPQTANAVASAPTSADPALLAGAAPPSDPPVASAPSASASPPASAPPPRSPAVPGNRRPPSKTSRRDVLDTPR